jgi:hypothetical protein
MDIRYRIPCRQAQPSRGLLDATQHAGHLYSTVEPRRSAQAAQTSVKGVCVCVCIQTARPVCWLLGISLAKGTYTAKCNKTLCAVPCCTVRTPARLCLEGDRIGVSCVRAWHRRRRCLCRPYTSACLRAYKECAKKVFPPLHVDACAVSQLPRHLLGRFLSLRYLAAVDYLGPSQLS